jgi:hypothetical protein
VSVFVLVALAHFFVVGFGAFRAVGGGGLSLLTGT